MSKYERLSINSDEDLDLETSFDNLRTSPEVLSWKNTERRRKLRSMLFVAVPALGIGGLILLLLGSGGGSSSSSSSTKIKPFLNSGWQDFRASDQSPHMARLSPHAVPRSEQEAIFSPGCTDLWISQGKLCEALTTAPEYPLREIEHISVVHTWQNGSDTRQSAARAAAQGDTSHGKSGTALKHFRSHNELRFSLRSVLHAFKDQPEALASFHIYTTDLPSEKVTGHRDGSVPTWLDLDEGYHWGSDVTIKMEFPWNVFKTSRYEDPHDAYQWRSEALPAFNSMAVESQFPNIETVADTIAYLCDDMFYMKPLTASDIASPIFGPNFRLVTDGWTNPAIKAGEYHGNKEIESESLAWSAWLIQERFGAKGEYLYLQHVSKVFRRSLLQEMESMWAEELSDAGKVTFRGRGTDINIHNLSIYFTMERHREALLWSAIVAKADANHDGTITPEELRSFLNEVGSRDYEELVVPFPRRDVNVDDISREAGLQPPKESRPAFTSANGYALAFPDSQKLGHTKGWVEYTEERETTFCRLNMTCFGDFTSDQSASDLFKKIAFEDVRCGDCILAGLMAASGPKGFEAFLPQDDTALSYGYHEFTQHRKESSDHVAVLPLGKNWKEIDFSLEKVKPPNETLRQFVSRLILRYSYIMGEASHHLIMLIDLESSTNDLGRIPSPPNDDSPALLGINDDIEREHDQVSALLNQWFESQWPEPADWETDVDIAAVPSN